MDASKKPELAGTDASRVPGRRWVVVSVAGDIDLASVPEVLGTLFAASEAKTAGIVVDVSAVTFFGAAGIGAFIQVRNHEREHGRNLVLRAPPPLVRRVLDICDLADLVEPPATAEPHVSPSHATHHMATTRAGLDKSD